MPEKTWVGSIFIKDEGGFDIIMRALNHYNRRLHRISESPEIADAGAMFGSILQSESARTAPRLKPVADRLRAGLADASSLAALEDDVEIMERAMICYKSDAQKAADNVHEYYAKLVEGNEHYRGDIGALDGCIRKLKRYD